MLKIEKFIRIKTLTKYILKYIHTKLTKYILKSLNIFLYNKILSCIKYSFFYPFEEILNLINDARKVYF